MYQNTWAANLSDRMTSVNPRHSLCSFDTNAEYSHISQTVFLSALEWRALSTAARAMGAWLRTCYSERSTRWTSSSWQHLLSVELQSLDATSRRVGVLGIAFNVPLQKFEPKKGREYDVVWLQFVTGYLVDTDFVALLIRLRSTLTHQWQYTNEKANGDNEASDKAVSAGGLIAIKDNVHVLDGPDISRCVSRSLEWLFVRERTCIESSRAPVSKCCSSDG